jgi:hypothetical protein
MPTKIPLLARNSFLARYYTDPDTPWVSVILEIHPIGMPFKACFLKNQELN